LADFHKKSSLGNNWILYSNNEASGEFSPKIN
jgi:hypothetical protein